MKRTISMLLVLTVLLGLLPGTAFAISYPLSGDIGTFRYDFRFSEDTGRWPEWSDLPGETIREAWTRLVDEGIIRKTDHNDYTVYYDLDKDGRYDVSIYTQLQNNTEREFVSSLTTRSLSGDYVIQFPTQWLEEWKARGISYYCSSFTFHFPTLDDLGMFTIDLRNGPTELETRTVKQSKGFNYTLSLLAELGRLELTKLEDFTYDWDLDLDGTPDLSTGWNMAEAKSDTKLTGAVTLKLSKAECQQAIADNYSYYSSITILFPGGEINAFADVKADDYYFDPVLWAMYHNPQITNGTDPDRFSPSATCTRGQVVTFLWRAMGNPEPTLFENPFYDVKESDYFYKPVRWAWETRITDGTGAHTFSPNAGCTRGQVVTFLWRAMEYPFTESTSCSFTDVKRDAYYYDAVVWAVDQGITNGTSNTAFSPDRICTRAQVVTFLYRALSE